MKLFGGILGQQKSKGAAEPQSPERIVSLSQARGKTPLNLTADMSVDPSAKAAAPAKPALKEVPPVQINIWDLEDTSIDGPSTPAAAPAKAADPLASPPQRTPGARRNRTRLIGFESSEAAADDPFEQAQQVAEVPKVMFPVGWLVLTDGPGRGHSFPLFAGMAQIGRGEDNAVQLDFGDNSVSRKNHAAIVYDPQERKFVLGHGGKSNIVRLNGKPLISNEDLSDGDVIKIGETTLILKALCGAAFDWSEGQGTESEEYTDVAIA